MKLNKIKLLYNVILVPLSLIGRIHSENNCAKHTSTHGICNYSNIFDLSQQITCTLVFEPHREKTGILPMRQQRRRSASR